jgi:hypothetical protein
VEHLSRLSDACRKIHADVIFLAKRNLLFRIEAHFPHYPVCRPDEGPAPPAGPFRVDLETAARPRFQELVIALLHLLMLGKLERKPKMNNQQNQGGQQGGQGGGQQGGQNDQKGGQQTQKPGQGGQQGGQGGQGGQQGGQGAKE